MLEEDPEGFAGPADRNAFELPAVTHSHRGRQSITQPVHREDDAWLATRLGCRYGVTLVMIEQHYVSAVDTGPAQRVSQRNLAEIP